MFGGGHPGKFGARGGGRAGGGTAPKRPGMVPHHHMSSPSFPTPPQLPLRSRPSSSAGGNNSGHPAAAADEAFRLETSSPLNFGMLIRLAPDLVDEMKRVQAQGLNARIKFDNNPNNSSGNVIDVGGKEFRFTWSRELGDPSDIYEEHRSGVNGNGLLVESGSAWRKLNVQRVLDESTRDHVKMRSEEAERLQKSRKAIILDHGNPSVKNHVRTLAAAPAEVNGRRMPFKQKKGGPLQKKQKVEPSAVAATVTAPSKPVQKLPATSSGSTGKARTSVSPVPSPPVNASIPVQNSTSPTGNTVRGSKLGDDVSGSRMTGSSNAVSSEKDLSGRFCPGSLHESVKGGIGSTQMDLRNLLISLLMENPKGMTLKALEKAVAEAIPNHGKKIETTIRTIANYVAPGRYFLKEDVEKEVTKRCSLESGRSPICPSGVVTGGLNFPEKITPEEFQQLPQLEPESTEPIDLKETGTHQESIDVFDDNQNIITEEEKVCSSSSESRSESDSESDSSDSGSISRSKSRSPVSASSSDSESDGSSSSQEGSDVHVDIMDDDDDGNDEGLHRFQGPDSRLSSSPITCRKSDNDYEQDDEHGFNSQLPSSALNMEEVGTHDGAINVIQMASFSPVSDRMKGSSEDKVELVPKEVSVLNITKDDNPEELVPTSSNDHESKLNKKEVCGESVNAITLKIAECGTKDGKETRGTFGTTPEKPEMDEAVPVSSSRIRADAVHSQDYALNAKREEGLRAEGRILPSSNWKSRDAGYSLGPRFCSPERLMEDPAAHSSGNLDNCSEKAVELGTKSKYSNLHQKKHSEQNRKPSKEEKFRATPQQSNTNDVTNAITAGNKGKLRREYSDLEIGEFREPISNEDPQDHNKQLERKSSFSRIEKIDTTENTYADPSYQKKRKKSTVDSTKPSPQFSDPGGQGFIGSQSGTKLPEMNTLNQTRQQQNVTGAPHLSTTDLVDVDSSSQLGRSSYTKAGKNDAKASHKVLLPGDLGNSERRNSANILHPHDAKVLKTSVGTKPKKSNQFSDSVTSKPDISQKENRICGKKRTYVPTDEQFPYAIYDKDKPELREAIQTESQYKEYTKEYCEKYSCYCSLNKALEDDRTHFQKLGCDLELAKDRDADAYANALGQLRRAYQQCVERHRQMKKIFIVLHDELKHLKKRIKDYAAVYMRESSLK